MSSVAVKNPDTSSPGVLDRLHVGILAGVVYVVGSLAIVFELLPWLWFGPLGRSSASAVDVSLLVIIGFAVAGGLAYLGGRLLGPSPTPGVKAGIFTTLLALLLVVLLTRWASIYFEGWVYDSRSLSETLGVVLTAAVGVVLLALAGRFLFLAPSFGPKMVAFEEQGWFSANSYKRSQGQRVRRGTILGILILVGCGIYSLESHGTLKGSENWSLDIPFTGKAQVTDVKDAAAVLGAALAHIEEGKPIDLGTFRDANARLKAGYVRIEEPNDAAEKFTKGQVVEKDAYDRVRAAIAKEKGKEPTIKTPDPATAKVTYQHLTLLPDVRYTLPILLAALGLWGAWRVVNVPSFADFLIATEAELNKVSWTPRRRLIQDTIVVLVTVILFTVFLFVVDIAWAFIMSSKPIGVIKELPKEGQGQAPGQKW